MTRLFYSSSEYRAKQSAITRKNWERGKFNFLLRKVTRICARKGCGATFTVTPHDPKIFCSQSCSAQVTNRKRKQSPETRQRIAARLRGRPSPLKGIVKVPYDQITCKNSACKKVFLDRRWERRQFCSNQCAMTVIGGRPTSPKASKGKNGIRKDISPTINFYSRWEANMARLYTHLGIRWQYAPKSFDIGGQKYTPDFYLPEEDSYIEVKNFWWKYSLIRDEKFRRKYPDIKLKVILRDEYLALEKRYSHLIPKWEYKNSK